MSAVFDYRNGEIPERVRELIETHLAIEAQDAKSAGTLGFMTRSLAIATLPHRKSGDFRFVRRNGDFTLTMMTAHPLGLPFGTLPRLLLTWVCTEVAQRRERVLSLGNNLASYLAELGLHNTGGKRGDITRLKHAMTTLFSSVISCHYEGKDSFVLQNVLLADKVDWWTPQNPEDAGQWQSSLMLSEPFFKECIDHVLPFDMRAVRGLRQSPLALDIYVWLTYRMSYLSKRTTIPWVALAGQFGSGYAMTEQGLRDFKRAFLRELKNVLIIYPQAKVLDSVIGLVLFPSPPHVAFKSKSPQNSFGF
ncbi:replication protein RepA [Amphibiibacter pelophylacis]|uniref:Replication protein RepA n=1 Tax=Amphibiibacter pelophylacis TaxID=1799477 RepID=A0ACC6P5J3_9BURK